MATFCQLKITQLAGTAISRSRYGRCLHYDAMGSRYNLQGKFPADSGTATLLRRYTSPEDPRNNLGASTTGESLENHVHARLIPELHRVD